MERQSSRAKGPNYVGTRQRPSSPSRKAHLQPVMVLGWMAWQDGLQTPSSAGGPSNLMFCIIARLTWGNCLFIACLLLAHDSVPEGCDC